MKYITKVAHIQSIILAMLLLISTRLYAQKPAINIHENGANWAIPGQATISNDGRYFIYSIRNQPAASSTLIIGASGAAWKTELVGAGTGTFTDDSKTVLYMKSDSLCLLTLGTNTREYIPGTIYYQQFKQGGTEWLAIAKSDQQLVLRNLATGQEKSFAQIAQFTVSPAGNALVLNKNMKDTAGTRSSLSWLSLHDLKASPIIETTDQLSNFAFDNAGSQFAFMSSKTEGTYDKMSFKKGMPEDIFKPQIDKKPNQVNTIYRYTPQMDKAELWVDDRTVGIDAGLKVGGGSMHFSESGARLFFKLEKVPVPLKMKDNPVMVEIWSYTDAYLPPEQEIPTNPITHSGATNDYIAVINKKDNRVLRLQRSVDLYNYEPEGDDFIIMKTYKETSHNPLNDYWKGAPQVNLVSAIDGSRKPLPKAGYWSLSPGEKYLSYFDNDKGGYCTYEIATGKTRYITAAIPFPVFYEDYNYNGGAKPGQTDQSPVWLKDDKAILIGDTYDIWQVDPQGVRPPVNITNGYGRKHGITLRYIMDFGNTQVPTPRQDLLLGGFRQSDKNGGYFSKKLGTAGDPVQLAMGPYRYGGVSSNLQGPVFLEREPGKPVKARDADVFVFIGESEKEAPNLFLTRDFKQVIKLTDLQPQKQFNWYTTELVNWKKFDGKMAQGILYKPENFDPKKKYPLIFWYYEKNSSGLHSFLTPETSIGDLNIPYFVSNGYLVFVPDIAYKLGATGESAYNAVASAARYLAQRPYVNSKKMGITGHSHGGYETNYLVTRTSLFAAALSANGPTDFISGYGSLDESGSHLGNMYENGQNRLGKTLWQDPKAYISNSPIFGADRVTTPLLLMYTKMDGIVRWGQAVEWFTALRRLNKKVWMLQYDNEVHTLWNPNNRLDYTIRMTQFFDHYLKEAPAPLWMTRGIPAKLKGVDDGLKLDAEIKTSGPGLLISEEQQKVDSLMRRKVVSSKPDQ